MEYIREMQKKDMNIMSEFLLMAATLLDIKCRMLLPVEVNEEGEEEDPRQELVEQLLQYKMYKYMSYELRDRQLDGERLLFKDETLPDEVKEYQEPVNLDALLDGLTLARLNEVFQEIMRRQNYKIDQVRSKFGKIEKEEITVEEKMEYLDTYITTHRKFSFSELLKNQRSKIQTVVTFLAILEMMKMGKISVVQENTFDDIMITSMV